MRPCSRSAGLTPGFLLVFRYAKRFELSLIRLEGNNCRTMREAQIKRRDAEVVLGGAHLECYAPMLHSYLLRRLRRPQDAPDCIQEIFVRFIRRSQKDPETVRDPLRFLLGIALNVVRESRRHTYITFDATSAENSGATDLRQPSDWEAQDHTAEQIEMREDIQHAISQLPQHHLTAWWLVDVEGMSYEEAARKTAFARNTISTYVCAARARLKLTLQDYWRTKKDRPK